MKKIDKRKSYYLTIDTETTNGLDDPLVYDLGYALHDKKGNIYESGSLVIYDIYVLEKELMKTAYYKNKLSQYEEELKNGERKMVTIFTARKIIYDLCKEYNVKAIIAHNARFDYKSLQTTLRYVTKSKMRWFFPYGIEIWDSMRMARDTICKQSLYKKFVDMYNLRTGNNRIPANAQTLYAYLTNNSEYEEKHTGLEDVKIEMAITCKCLRQHKKMRKLAFGR
jgi:DNA polymerase III epsilon subunit-like protein